MMRKIGYILLTCCLLACSKKAETESEKKGIRINFNYSPLSVDPRKSSDPVTSTLSFMLYEGLTHLEEDGSISNALAEKIEISEDKKVYTFTLRPAMWSDGSPLTAFQFEAAWKRALSPSFPSRSSHLLFPLKNGHQAKLGQCSIDEVGVQALDETTLIVHLERPTPYFLDLTSYCAYFPVPYNGDEVPNPNHSGELLSNGPFMLTKWKGEDEIRVVKNPFYWNSDTVTLEAITISIIENEETALKLFEKGELDMVGGLISTLPLDAIPSLKSSNLLFHKPLAGTTFCAFNVHAFPFHNAHIRRAFAKAICRKKITQELFQHYDDIATSIVPPILKENSCPMLEEKESLSAHEELELGLSELGLSKKEFPKVTYTYFSSELHRTLATAIQNEWMEVLGIEVEIQAVDFKTHLSKLSAQDFMIAQMSWISQYSDPMTFLERFEDKNSCKNYSGWENAEYREYLSASYYASQSGRQTLIEKAESILLEDMPCIPLYHFRSVYLKSPQLQGLFISPMGDIQFQKATLTPPSQQ